MTEPELSAGVVNDGLYLRFFNHFSDKLGGLERVDPYMFGPGIKALATKIWEESPSIIDPSLVRTEEVVKAISALALLDAHTAYDKVLPIGLLDPRTKLTQRRHN